MKPNYPRKGLDVAHFRPRIARIERRLFLKQGLSLGALTLLSGCTLKDDDAVDRVLWAMSRWNDRVQAALFNPDKLAPSYTEAEVATPFPFNAFYEEALAPVIAGADYRLRLSGLIKASALGRCKSCMHCQKRHRSRALSALRAGALSENGAAFRSKTSLNASGRI